MRYTGRLSSWAGASDLPPVAVLTLSQDFEPFGYRETRHDERPKWAGACPEEEQIGFAPKQAEQGARVEEVCRKMGISEAPFYVWKKRYGGVGPSELRRLRQLEEENRKLKQIEADLSLDKAMLKVVVAKKL